MLAHSGSTAEKIAEFVQAPLFAGPWPSVAQAVGKALAEFLAPALHRFIGDDDTTLGQEQFDISQTEAEHV
jgi:hypothetical protein